MNAKNWKRLETLAANCAAALRDPQQQSERIWRGDMWAIIGAHHEIRKTREKAQAADAVARSVSSQVEPSTREKGSSSPSGRSTGKETD